MVTYRERLPLLKSHEPLITLPMRGHDTIEKKIFFMRRMTAKFGRILISGRSSECKRVSRHRRLDLLVLEIGAQDLSRLFQLNIIYNEKTFANSLNPSFL